MKISSKSNTVQCPFIFESRTLSATYVFRRSTARWLSMNLIASSLTVKMKLSMEVRFGLWPFRQMGQLLPLARGKRFASSVRRQAPCWQTWATTASTGIKFSGLLLSRHAIRGKQPFHYWLLAAITAMFICGTHQLSLANRMRHQIASWLGTVSVWDRLLTPKMVES